MSQNHSDIFRLYLSWTILVHTQTSQPCRSRWLEWIWKARNLRRICQCVVDWEESTQLFEIVHKNIHKTTPRKFCKHDWNTSHRIISIYMSLYVILCYVQKLWPFGILWLKTIGITAGLEAVAVLCQDGYNWSGWWKLPGRYGGTAKDNTTLCMDTPWRYESDECTPSVGKARDWTSLESIWMDTFQENTGLQWISWMYMNVLVSYLQNAQCLHANCSGGLRARSTCRSRFFVAVWSQGWWPTCSKSGTHIDISI